MKKLFFGIALICLIVNIKIFAVNNSCSCEVTINNNGWYTLYYQVYKTWNKKTKIIDDKAGMSGTIKSFVTYPGIQVLDFKCGYFLQLAPKNALGQNIRTFNITKNTTITCKGTTLIGFSCDVNK